MTSNLAAIQADIAHARQWARKHFNAYVNEEKTPSHLLAPPTMLVAFPEPDTMRVYPVSYGQLLEPGAAEFKLCWKGTHGLAWVGNFLIRKELYGEEKAIELRVI